MNSPQPESEGSQSASAFLVVLDGTAECARALRFAALRAMHTGASLKLLHIISPTGFLQWGAVQKAMEAEVAAEAMAMLEEQAAVAASLMGRRPDVMLRQGKPVEEIRRLLSEDSNIRCLVLAAAARGRPGPLVDHFAGEQSGSLPCLVIIVPGGIDDAALERLT